MVNKKEKEVKNTITEKQRTITDFLSTDYLVWAHNVVEERALPSVIDGLKPAARKVLNAAFEGSLKNGQLSKLLALTGDTMKLSLYAHGDSSISNVIVGLCKTFQNNLNPLESDSQVGSLRDPDASGAPRYLYVKLSNYSDIYKTDIDLTNKIFEEGQYVEPMNYLPIIPTVLCEQNLGVAVGYSMHNMSYSPLDVIDACLEYVNNPKLTMFKTCIHPYIKGIKPKNWVYKNEFGVWYNYGEYKLDKKKDIMYVTDLPADTSYEAFEKLLNKLIDNQYIKDWRNYSSDGNINYEVVFFKGQLAKFSKSKSAENLLANKFKLIKRVAPDLLWLIDEKHKLRYFADCYDVVKYFVNYRLTIYTERKKKLVDILEKRYKDNCDLVKFIELVCNNKLKLKNRPKADIKADMDGYNLPFVLISTPMSKVTIEERDELLKQNDEIKKQLDYIKKTTEKQMYKNDLNTLRSKLEKEFK